MNRHVEINAFRWQTGTPSLCIISIFGFATADVVLDHFCSKTGVPRCAIGVFGKILFGTRLTYVADEFKPIRWSFWGDGQSSALYGKDPVVQLHASCTWPVKEVGQLNDPGYTRDELEHGCSFHVRLFGPKVWSCFPRELRKNLPFSATLNEILRSGVYDASLQNVAQLSEMSSSKPLQTRRPSTESCYCKCNRVEPQGRTEGSRQCR